MPGAPHPSPERAAGPSEPALAVGPVLSGIVVWRARDSDHLFGCSSAIIPPTDPHHRTKAAARADVGRRERPIPKDGQAMSKTTLYGLILLAAAALIGAIPGCQHARTPPADCG